MSEPAAGAPITVEHLLEAMRFLDDWEDRYRFIMDLGKKLPPMPDDEKTDDNFVHGCQSRVWVSLRESSGSTSPVVLHADSDAFIVKGLAAMVVVLVAGRSAREIVGFDIESVFDELGLHEHLSPTRSNGLHGMIKQVRERAALLAAS
ncbi:MAG: cysteine desulfuration protein SufE [Phycisphaerae bacterium]|nr:cysteine desulfuration protein SufE [Phycisphaerae bacterium]HBZ96454.1 cysteine desulfuration protein SufE [Phycisphaerales bacterium]|tara:strand:+ start:150 stop:593 length:444 start_codon:yes stop_codon:yes gene_type:complete